MSKTCNFRGAIKRIAFCAVPARGYYVYYSPTPELGFLPRGGHLVEPAEVVAVTSELLPAARTRTLARRRCRCGRRKCWRTSDTVSAWLSVNNSLTSITLHFVHTLLCVKKVNN